MRDLPRRSRLVALALGVLGIPACVTYEIADDLLAPIPLVGAEPVVIPLGGDFGGGQPSAVDAFYASIVAQAQTAFLEREPDVLHALLLRHDRPSAPDWARERLAGLRRLLVGLRFEEHLAGHARIRDVAPGQTLGDSVEFELVVEPAPFDIVLPGGGGGGAATTFLFEALVRDEDVFGNVTTREFSEFVRLQADERPARRALRVPFRVPRLSVEGLRREIRVRSELMPGTLSLDGDAVPNRRVALAETRIVHWPAQVENVAARPLETLRVALQQGDPDRFRYIYVASHHLDAEHAEIAIDLLISALRAAPPPLARVCTVALRSVTGLDIGIGDRDGWLAWWQRRPRD